MGAGPNDKDVGNGRWFHPADRHDLDSYRRAEADLARLRIPVLLRAHDPHQRLYIAALDGTGNSMFNDAPESWSVVARIARQVENLESQGGKNIAGGYVEGTFTQEGLLRTPQRWLDGRFGQSFGERVETAYYEFCVQAKKWLDEDPKADIRIAGVGFSRGAEQVAALLRMIEERGIRDPADAKVLRDRDNVIARIEYADKPPLVAPGKTLQAALLFDPVATGVEEHDRRLPASSMVTFQISAEDERRDLFKVTDHVPPGFSEEYRNLNVTVGGVHSDIGGTYPRNGLGTLSFNLGVTFLNRLSDRDYLEPRPVPDDPAQFVVHRSDRHLWSLYGTRGYDRDGIRDRTDELAPAILCPAERLRECQRKAPINPALDARVERRTGAEIVVSQAVSPHHAVPRPHAPGRVCLRQDPGTDAEHACLEAIFERLYQGARSRDDRAMDAAVHDYLRSPPGQRFQREVLSARQRMEPQEDQAALEAQPARPAPQAEAMRKPHVMRM